MASGASEAETFWTDFLRSLAILDADTPRYGVGPLGRTLPEFFTTLPPIEQAICDEGSGA